MFNFNVRGRDFQHPTGMELLSEYGRETVQNIPQIETWKKLYWETYLTCFNLKVEELNNILQIMKNYWKVEVKEDNGSFQPYSNLPQTVM